MFSQPHHFQVTMSTVVDAHPVEAVLATVKK
jgi:hypothetical protein